MLPKLFTKKYLGVDLGTSSIRIVELEKIGRNFVLSNYGQIDLGQVESDVPHLTKRSATVFSPDEIAEMIQTVISNAKIKTRQCAFSIPDFSTFFTSFSLPSMTPRELPEAVIFEARQHIPLPVESVTIDWQLVNGNNEKAEKMEVTVAAIPNEIISQYKEIAVKANLEVTLMEAEMFGLAEALVLNDEMRPICLVDIGSQSSVCSLIEKRVLRYSHSFDRGGDYLAEEMVKRIPVNEEMAKNIRDVYGLRLISLVEPEVKKKIKEIMAEALNPIFREIEMMLSDYSRLSNSEVCKIVLSGGLATVAEVKDQFANYFKKDVEIADPFKEVDFPPALGEHLRDIGPAYAVAVGMARRGLELLNKHKK